MSSALWHFFWTVADWGGAPPPPPPAAPTTAQDLGSGGGDYDQASEDFWDAREAYLRSLLPEMQLEPPRLPKKPAGVPAAPPPTSNFFNWRLLPRYEAERTAAISTVRAATDLKSLQAAAFRLRELNIAVARASRLKREAFHRRKLNRANRKLAALQSAQILLEILLRAGYT